DEVGDRRAAAAETPSELLLGEAEVLDKCRAGPGLVHGAQVLPDDVLDQRRLEARGLTLVPHDPRHRLKACLASRAPSPLARDQLVAAVGQRPNDQRLYAARVGDRCRPAPDPPRVEAGAGL